MMKRSMSLLLTLGVWFWSSPAFGNVVGVDTQNFNPITDGLDYVTVHSSKTLEPGIINLGVFLNYAVNSLPNYENVSNQSRTDFVDTLFSSDLNVGIGLTRNWDAGFSMPQVHAQSVDSDVFRGEFENTGVTEFRLNTKVRILGNPIDGGVALVATMNLNQIEDNPFAGTNPGPTFNFEAIWDHSFGDTTIAANVGYRLRNPGDPIAGVPVNPFGDQYIASVGASYLMPQWDTKLIGEIYTSFPAESDQFATDRDHSSAELLVGIKTDLRHDLALHVGGGTEIIHGTGAPDWRVYTGLNWNIGPMFAKKEDVLVKVDDTGPMDPLAGEGGDPFAGIPTSQERFVAKDVLFAFDSADVKEDFKEILRRMVDYLNRPPGFERLVIEGHTDSVGSAEYNLDLSRRRAASVRQVLIDVGLDPNKVKSEGLGETNPIASNANYQGRARNRRVEFRIYRK
ncbi:MAG: OmpA family protein [Bdellovibrionaceae bacterium]|nr:OmpA family protein [Bdellovibrionales bacterium]MCB9083935.1 OmpA family protein [Pseudobdellovibrionaceae bacterium]